MTGIGPLCGKCPKCESFDYGRCNNESFEDYIKMDCRCENCQAEFTEYFILASVEEERFDDDNLIHFQLTVEEEFLKAYKDKLPKEVLKQVEAVIFAEKL